MTVNPHPIDFQAYKRRRAAAARCAPLDHSGRRDPDGRPAFDPDARARRDALAHLAAVAVWRDTPQAVRDSITVILDTEGDAA